MAFQKCNDLRLHARAILAVRHGRKLGEQIAAMHDAPTGDVPRANLAATLRRLEAGEVTDGRDLVVLETLHAGLAERMTLEIVGSKADFRHVGHDEDGEVWAAVDVPVYSNRGQEARSAYERLERFIEVRQQLLDHAKADRLIRHLLS